MKKKGWVVLGIVLIVAAMALGAFFYLQKAKAAIGNLDIYPDSSSQ